MCVGEDEKEGLEMNLTGFLTYWWRKTIEKYEKPNGGEVKPNACQFEIIGEEIKTSRGPNVDRTSEVHINF
jgi:hypothetical protein